MFPFRGINDLGVLWCGIFSFFHDLHFFKPYICVVVVDAVDTPKYQLILNIKTTSKFRPPRGSCLQVMYVMSLLTALRQWAGLMNIPKSLLAKHILKPLKADYFCINDYQQSSLVLKVLQALSDPIF